MKRWKYWVLGSVRNIFYPLYLLIIITTLISSVFSTSTAIKSSPSHRKSGAQKYYRLINSTVASEFNRLSNQFLTKRITSTDDKNALKLKSINNDKENDKIATSATVKKKSSNAKKRLNPNSKDFRQGPVPAPPDPLTAIAPFVSLLPFGLAPIVYVLFAFVITNLSIASVNRGVLTANLDQAETVLDNINTFTGLPGRKEYVQIDKKYGHHRRNSTLQASDEYEDDNDDDDMNRSQEIFQKIGIHDFTSEDTAFDVMLSKVTLGNLIRVLGTALAVSYIFEIRPGPALVISTIFIGAILWTRIIADQSRINHRSLTFNMNSGS